MQASQLPVWVQYVKDLGPSVVAIVAAGIAGYIAWRQWRTAHYRLRLDMYDRRFAVYEATSNLISTVTLHGQITPDDLGNFYRGIRGAEFLFDGDTRNFVMKIGDLAFRARMARMSWERQSNHPRSDQLIDQEEEILRFLRDEDKQLEKLFGRYLDLSKVAL